MQIINQKHELVAVDRLKPHPKNPNVGSVEAIQASIDENGWYGAIIAQHSTGYILVGHHRYQAAVQAGAEKVPVFWVDVDDSRALKILLADNRTAELAHRDDELLAEVLRELAGTDDGLLGTGYDTEDLEQLLTGLSEDPADTGSPTGEAAARTTLAERFIAPPFSVLDSRAGYWRERKRAWLALGLRSETGRDVETFAQSSQPPALYELRNEMRARSGVDPSWDEVIAEAQRLGRYVAPGVSIFDPVLCELAYTWFCPPAGTILDPFAGGSVRGVVAAKLGHTYLGIELRAEQIEANQTNWDEIEPNLGAITAAPAWVHGDSRDLPTLLPEVQTDLLFSCPPYFDLEVYSDDPRDLSNADDYPAFVQAYREIIAGSVASLREDRFAIFVVSDVRDKRGLYVGLLADTIRAFEDAGAHLYNEAILLNQVASAAIRVGGQFPTGRKLGRTHQNVLVFYKGDPAKIRQYFPAIEVPDLSTFESEENAGLDGSQSP